MPGRVEGVYNSGEIVSSRESVGVSGAVAAGGGRVPSGHDRAGMVVLSSLGGEGLVIVTNLLHTGNGQG
jgi:hypothetical protein